MHWKIKLGTHTTKLRLNFRLFEAEERQRVSGILATRKIVGSWIFLALDLFVFHQGGQAFFGAMPKRKNNTIFLLLLFLPKQKKSNQKLLFSTFKRRFLRNTQSNRYVLLSWHSGFASMDRNFAQTFVNAVWKLRWELYYFFWGEAKLCFSLWGDSPRRIRGVTVKK